MASRATTAMLRKLAAERILVLDGAMGTMIQAMKLDEEGYRGARFDAWNRAVQGNNDLLNLSRADAIRDIHYAYFRAGADIVSTNTFSSTSIAQADYGLEASVYDMNVAGARLARAALHRRRGVREGGAPHGAVGARPAAPDPAAAAHRPARQRPVHAGVVRSEEHTS